MSPMNGIMKGAALLAALIALAPFVAPPAVAWAQNLMSTSMDHSVGSIILPKSVGEIFDGGTFKGQRYLVVGGTKGIGRGIAVNLAEAGASVDVVGRSGGEVVVRQLTEVAAALSTGADFEFYKADLSTLAACADFVSELEGKQRKYAGLVMTLGVWPDFGNPATSEGYDRVVFMDIIARFSVLKGMYTIGALEEGASVMNVLASGMINSNTKENIGVIKGAFGRDSNRSAQMQYMKGVVAPAGDIMIAQASSAFPQLRYIGTNPGIVPTTLLESTIGKVGSSVLWAIGNFLTVTISEEQCGSNHLNILHHVKQNDVRFSLWDERMESHTMSPLSANQELGQWMWAELSSIVADGK